MSNEQLTARLRTRLGMISPQIDRTRLDLLRWRHATPLLVAAELVGVEADLSVRWHDEEDRPLDHRELQRASTVRWGRLPLRSNDRQVGELRFYDPLKRGPRLEALVGEESLGLVRASDTAAVETLAVRLAERLRTTRAAERSEGSGAGFRLRARLAGWWRRFGF